MKYIFLALLLCFNSAHAGSCKSGETVPVSEVEALLKAGLYDLARQKLEKVVVDCPASYKANQYLYQVYGKLNMQTEAINQRVKAEALAPKPKPVVVTAPTKDKDSDVGTFFISLIFVFLLLIGGYVGYLWYSARKEEERELKALQDREKQVREEIYTEVLAAREEIEELLVELSLNKSSSEAYTNNLLDARRISTDLVEMCYKDINNLDVDAARAFLRDVRSLIKSR